jgi:hypothetical protein
LSIKAQIGFVLMPAEARRIELNNTTKGALFEKLERLFASGGAIPPCARGPRENG